MNIIMVLHGKPSDTTQLFKLAGEWKLKYGIDIEGNRKTAKEPVCMQFSATSKQNLIKSEIVNIKLSLHTEVF